MSPEFAALLDQRYPERNPRDVLEWAAKRSGVTVAAMWSGLATRELVRARRVAAVALRDVCAMGPSEIGRVLGRDHSTVIGYLK